MASEKYRDSADEVKSSAETCSLEVQLQQVNESRAKTTATGKRAVRCVDCRKTLDDWRMLQQHKRKYCPNSTVRFSCRECGAFFRSKVLLNDHISAAHVGYLSGQLQGFKTNSSEDSCQNKLKISSAARCEETLIDLTEESEPEGSVKLKKVHKCRKKSVDLQKLKSAKAAKRIKKFKKRVKDVKRRELNKSAGKIRAVGSNPFTFTTSSAPDAQLFQFLCQSCLTVRFASYTDLRQHEEWCSRTRNGEGYLCLPCGRHYRTQGTLRRHAGEYHTMSLLPEVTKIVGNPFHFSTTVALDAASYPHVCSSCLSACFSSAADLRKHEDWCGQCSSAKEGRLKCNKCGRCFRTAALLERHSSADDCAKTGNVTGAVDDRSCDQGMEFESPVRDVKQKVVPVKVYGVCPLCDMPFMNQHEQQVHFMNVHNLTASKLKVKQSAEIQSRSRRRQFGTQVTCLDCDRMFSSRLELAQHKRICAKEKQFTTFLLPATPPVSIPSDSNLSTGERCCAVEDGKSAQKKDGPKADEDNMCGDILDRSAAKQENQSEGTVTELLSRTSGTRKLEVSQEMLNKTTKMRDLIRHSGAKKLLMQSDGKMLLIGDDGQKILTMSVVRGQKPMTGKLETNKDLVSTSPSLKRVCMKENSSQNEDTLQMSKPEVNHFGKQHQSHQHPSKRSNAKNDSALEQKTCCDVNNRQKSKRKRTKQDDVATVVDFSPKNRVNTAKGKNIVKKTESVQQNRKSNKSADAKHRSVAKAVDRLAADSDSEVKISDVESSSQVTARQQNLLEALQLVPVTAESNRPSAVQARYHTRSTTAAKGDVAKRSRSSNDSKNMSGSLASSTEELASLAETASKRSKTIRDVKHERVNGETAPKKTQTVEPVAGSLVRCVACKVIFRTVRQIVDHKCAGK